jgi:hypothetical protein
MNDNENCVVAYFVNEAAADAAVVELRKWDDRVKDVKLGTIGKILRDASGKVKVDIVHGGLFKNHLHLSDADVATIGLQLDGTKVALGVNADDYEVSMLKTNLEMAGGSVIPLGDVYDAEEKAAAAKAADEASQQMKFEGTTDRAIDIAAINKSGFN